MRKYLVKYLLQFQSKEKIEIFISIISLIIGLFFFDVDNIIPVENRQRNSDFISQN